MNEIYAYRARVYFKTNATSAKQGFEELLNVAEKNGIEIYAENVHLRNNEGEEISNCKGND